MDQIWNKNFEEWAAVLPLLYKIGLEKNAEVLLSSWFYNKVSCYWMLLQSNNVIIQHRPACFLHCDSNFLIVVLGQPVQTWCSTCLEICFSQMFHQCSGGLLKHLIRPTIEQLKTFYSWKYMLMINERSLNVLHCSRLTLHSLVCCSYLLLERFG